MPFSTTPGEWELEDFGPELRIASSFTDPASSALSDSDMYTFDASSMHPSAAASSEPDWASYA